MSTLIPRIIPALLIDEDRLVKTVRFSNPTYIGDPVNTVRIFNELEADELLLLDISRSATGRGPNYSLLRTISDECFMPVAYGGDVRSEEQAATLFSIGFEKVVVNTSAVENPALVTRLAARFGSQAVIASIDVKAKSLWRPARVYSRRGTNRTPLDPVEWAKRLEELGAGELLVTSIDREGTWSGLDIPLLKSITGAVDIPVIAHGGAGTIAHVREALFSARASAVGLGSMTVFQRQGMGVLVNLPHLEDSPL